MDLLKAGVCALTLTLAGCATGPSYQSVMDSYVGASRDQLINKWGYPHRRHTLPGGEAFEYVRSSSVQMPVMVNHVGNQSYAAGGGTRSHYCRTVFELDHSGRVNRVTWQGNSCKAK